MQSSPRVVILLLQNLEGAQSETMFRFGQDLILKNPKSRFSPI